jgi:hypothetical protein
MMRAIPTKDTLKELENCINTATNTNNVSLGGIDACDRSTERARNHQPLGIRTEKPVKTRLSEAFRLFNDDSDVDNEPLLAAVKKIKALPRERTDPLVSTFAASPTVRSSVASHAITSGSTRGTLRETQPIANYLEMAGTTPEADAIREPGKISTTIILYKHNSHANLYIFCYSKQQQFD